MDWRHMTFPSTKLCFCITHSLLKLIAMLEWLSLLSWHNWSIVKEVQDKTGLLRQDDLLLCTLNDRRSMQVVGFLEFLACDVRKLRFGDQ
jgi:hypothetical protein